MTNGLARLWNTFLDAQGGNEIVGDKNTFLKQCLGLEETDWKRDRTRV